MTSEVVFLFSLTEKSCRCVNGLGFVTFSLFQPSCRKNWLEEYLMFAIITLTSLLVRKGSVWYVTSVARNNELKKGRIL